MENTYIVIETSMITDLGLKGNRLLVFALIYGFCRDGRSEFWGSLDYIEKTLGISRPTAVSVLSSLVEDGFLLKREYCDEHNQKRFAYSMGGQVPSQGVVKFLNQGWLNFLTRGSKKTLPNNTIVYTNNINKKENIIKEKADADIISNADAIPNANANVNPSEAVTAGTPSGRFAKPTAEQVDAYAKEKGYDIDGEQFVDYYESKGWMIGKSRMKDWKAAVRTWGRNRMKGNGTAERNDKSGMNDLFASPQTDEAENTPKIINGKFYY